MYSQVENEYAGKIIVSEDCNPKTFFPHQLEAFEGMDEKINSRSKYKGLLVLPTGGGKTLTSVIWIMKNVLDKGDKVLWIAHRHELLNQALDTFYGNAYSDIMSKKKAFKYRIISGIHDKPVNLDKDDDVIIASKESVNRGIEFLLEKWVKPNSNRIFMVIDEAHHATAKSYRKIIEQVENHNPNSFKLLGLTATPYRTAESEKGLIGKLFENDMAYEIGLTKLINRQILSKPVIEELNVENGYDFGRELSVQDIKNIMKFDKLPEWVAAEIAEGKNRNKFIINQYVQNKERYGQTLVFALNKVHAITLNSLFNARGVKSEFVISDVRDSSTGLVISNEENIEKLNKFRKKEIQVLVNVNIVTEGIDLPNVQTVFLTRPTISTVLMTQMIGRGLRGIKVGGTEETYIVSFIDDWKDKIAWVNPAKLFIDEDGDFEESEKAKARLAKNLISIHMMEVFAKLMDKTARNKKLKEMEFKYKIPEGLYYFTYLYNDDTGAEMEKVCDVMVYSHLKNIYQRFVDDLEEIFKKGNLLDKEQLLDYEAEYLTQYVYDNYFDDADLELGYRKEDIEDIIRFYAFKGVKPTFIEFKERDEYDIRTIAENICESRMDPYKQRDYVDELWNEENSKWKIFFGNNKDYFIENIDIEIKKIIYGDKEAKVPEIKHEPIDIVKLPLHKIRQHDERYWRELVEGVYGKYTDENGYYYCAISGYKSKRRWDFHIDHIKPMSKGGLSVPENLQLLEKYVNVLLGDKDKDIYVESTKTDNETSVYSIENPVDQIKQLILEGNLEKALATSRKAIRIDPEDSELYSVLGDIYFAKGNYDDAHMNYEKSKRIKKTAKAWLGIGLCLLKKGKQDIAETYFKEALKIEPDCTIANFEIGKYRFDTKKFKHSLGYFKKVLEVEPMHEMANYYMAKALKMINEFEEAWKYINKSIESGESQEKIELLNTINRNLGSRG